jgi:hypothetical protein
VNAQKQLSAKKAWSRLSERARLGEKFGFIGCLGLLYKSGALTREQVVKHLNEGKITREDLQRFRKISTKDLV